MVAEGLKQSIAHEWLVKQDEDGNSGEQETTNKVKSNAPWSKPLEPYKIDAEHQILSVQFYIMVLRSGVSACLHTLSNTHSLSCNYFVIIQHS